jgi:arylsulfatase A-like enzyme
MRDVLLITVDSLRADHLGMYGYDRQTSPRIDQLASGSLVFDRAFAHACATRPSFPTILTSTYPEMYGGYEMISNNRTLLSEAFNTGGYQTGGFHSNLYLSADFGYSKGYDEFFDSKTDPSLTAKARQLVKAKIDEGSRLRQLLKRAFDATEKHTGVEVGPRTYPPTG